MAFTNHSFTKNWNNSSDFSAYCDSEEQVREDIQQLHDETKNFINNVMIPELQASTAAANLGAIGVDGSTVTTIQAVMVALKALVDACETSAAASTSLAFKADKTETATHIKSVSFNPATGVFVFTKESGATVSIDTLLEKVATNWTYDSANQALILTLADGTTQSISLSAFITETEFLDSNTVDFSVSNHVVTATIKSGSVTDAMLDSVLVTSLQNYVSAAATSATNAAASESNAAGSASAAATSATNAASSASAAATSASGAASSKTAAADSASSAATSAANASTSETNALSSKNAAASSATAAATSASNAAASVTAVATSATNAGTSATNAATSETNAATSETNALSSKNAAASSASAAATSKANAATSESNASASASSAATSASNASTSATNASTSATNASTSANAASTSATNSEASKLNSEAYAVGKRNGTAVSSGDATYHNNSKYYSEQASASAGSASTSATNAGTSETNASTSASNAATSETNALSSKNEAATSESNASASASSASTSATSASASALSASTSAGNASASEANAVGSAITSESWAVGGTSSRTGEDTNNAKYWSMQAQSAIFKATINTTTIAELDEAYAAGKILLVAPDWTDPEIKVYQLMRAVAGTEYDFSLPPNRESNVTTLVYASLNPEDATTVWGTEAMYSTFAVNAITVAVSAWVGDTTYSDYPYRAAISISTSGYTAGAATNVSVVFGLTEAVSGNFAPVCTSYSGGVYIYAKAIPDATITIPRIICEEVSQ